MNNLFKLVFSNIVLLRKIEYYARLYIDNEYVVFDDIEELREYKEREYIRKLEYLDYNSERLEIGDLPIGGELKEVILDCKVPYKGEAIPYGVEIIRFKYGYLYNTPLSTLPPTIHTIENATILRNRKHKNSIPPTVTSISFLSCINISRNNYNGNGFIVIPNTVRELTFYNNWCNEGVSLNPGDIPFGITNLSISNTQIGINILPDSITKLKIGNYDSKYLNSLELPKSIKQLEFQYEKYGIHEKEIDYSDGLFNFLPPDLETLIIKCKDNITQNSNLFKCKSLKKLIIHLEKQNTIKPNSLPPSITELEIFGAPISIEPNMFFKLDN